MPLPATKCTVGFKGPVDEVEALELFKCLQYRRLPVQLLTLDCFAYSLQTSTPTGEGFALSGYGGRWMDEAEMWTNKKRLHHDLLHGPKRRWMWNVMDGPDAVLQERRAVHKLRHFFGFYEDEKKAIKALKAKVHEELLYWNDLIE